MKLPVPLVVLLSFVSCGGQAVSSGQGGTSGSSDDASVECSGAASCVLCSDGNWHCGGSVFPPCSLDASTSPGSGSCSGSCALGQTCLTCGRGAPATISCGSGGACGYDLLMGETCPP
jgi:hypothetical protein